MKKLLSNVQILSALIWAAVIISCSYVAQNNDVSSILITAAGFHLVMLTKFTDKKTSCE